MPFDDRFAENVRRVFDNYSEPVDEQAWLQMKKRLRAGSKTGMLVVLPLWIKAAAAVALMVLISGSLWIFFLKPEAALQTTSHEQKEEIPVISEEAITGQPLPLIAVDEPVIREKEADARKLTAITPQPAEITEPAGEQKSGPDISLPALTGLREDIQRSLTEIRGLFPETVSSDLTADEKVTDADADAMIIIGNLERVGHDEISRDRRSLMEVSAGSMKTWSPQEMAGGMGYSAGITGDWRVGNRWSISGGGLLVYNQFRLDRTTGSMNYAKQEHYSMMPGADRAAGFQVLQQKTTTDFEFMAIDLPVNIRYTVREMARSRLYLSAGLSSFIYLQQNYTSQSEMLAEFQEFDDQGLRVVQTSYDVTSSGSFDAFRRTDLARFFNFSGGYVIRGRNHSMVIEPFLKYPLGSVTNLNLNIGMAGLSLKYRPQ